MRRCIRLLAGHHVAEERHGFRTAFVVHVLHAVLEGGVFWIACGVGISERFLAIEQGGIGGEAIATGSGFLQEKELVMLSVQW
jgi:hypothetical protein